MEVNWIIPTASILAAVVVASANFFAQRWRYRIDHTAASVEQLCGEVNAAADLATRYWLMSSLDQNAAADIKALEAQIIGRQLRIQSTLLALGRQDPRLDLTHLRREVSADFYDALSGGNFRVNSRTEDIARAQFVQAKAAEMNGAIRAALADRSRRLY